MLKVNSTNSKPGKAVPADYGKAAAFPFILQIPNPLNPLEIQVQVNPGISIRDYFAAQTLATCTESWGGGSPDTARDVAEWCYRLADAMLKARESKGEDHPSQFHEDYLKK